MTDSDKLPEIIQGGMGIGVSNWRLAKSVSMEGQIGVVSGTSIDAVIARRLQLGDDDGNVRRALSHFPSQEMAERVLDKYFIPDGKAEDKPFKLVPMPTLPISRSYCEMLIVSNFVEVFLAKEGHDGLIGINYLEKVQLPTLPSLFGAMLAGVDYVLMGAGIPLAIPGFLDGLSRWEEIELKFNVENNPDHKVFSHRLDPNEFFSGELPELKRPKFLAIVSSEIIAKTLVRKATGFVDGFIVENHTAGGHNAPPRRSRGKELSDSPYGEKDIPNLDKIKKLGRPFWIAGGHASPSKLKAARNSGAEGVQVGTAFALCDESGVMAWIKKKVIAGSLDKSLKVITDFRASPTGYPFKVVDLKNTITDRDRKRICDLGYLRQMYLNEKSELGYRCPAEPVNSYISKGGTEEETIGKQCLCNELLATIGLGQIRGNETEPPIVTAGEDYSFISDLVEGPDRAYSAKDVIDYLKS